MKRNKSTAKNRRMSTLVLTTTIVVTLASGLHYGITAPDRFLPRPDARGVMPRDTTASPALPDAAQSSPTISSSATLAVMPAAGVATPAPSAAPATSVVTPTGSVTAVAAGTPPLTAVAAGFAGSPPTGPPGTRALPGPRRLFTVLPDAFPQGPASGDPHFGVVEAYLSPNNADHLHVGWERVQIRWDQLQPRGPSQWDANATDHDRQLDGEIARGRRLVGVIQGVPGWAALHPSEGNASVPRGIDLPWNDPRNYWAQLVYRAARHYAGRIDTLIILNEVNIANGPYRQFDGTPRQYAQMLRVAYLAAHAANPHVEVHIYGDSVYADKGLWFGQVVSALAHFDNARANNFFFDAAEVHLYNTVLGWDTLIGHWHALMRTHGFDRPIWLSETNIAPRNDYVSPALAADHNALLSVQPDFIVEAFATALGLGMPREEVYRMLDPRVIWPEHPYGLVRHDGSVRPEYYAFKTIMTWLAGVTATRYEPGGEPYANKKPIFRVIMERPGQEIQVLWNQSGRGVVAVVPAAAPTATVVRPNGTTYIVRARQGRFRLLLGAASDRSVVDRNLYVVGGPPLIVVQQIKRGRHVPSLRRLFVEANRGAGAGNALGPVTSLAIAPDGSGTRAIADTTHDRVLIEDASGRVTARIGGTGGAPGRFRGPAGVAIGADGTLYVADQGNARIQEFDLGGHLLGGFGRYDAGEASLRAPNAIAVARDGTIYVVDIARDAILHFSRQGDFLGRWGSLGYGYGKLDGPGGICVDSSGHIYVADTLNNRVVAFDPAGRPILQIGAGADGLGATGLHWPTDVTILPDGEVAVADAGGKRIVLSRPPTALTGFMVDSASRPGGLAIAPDSSYFVSDTANNHILHYDAGGRLVSLFGTRGFGQGQYFQPMGLAFGPDGNLYVADSGNNRIDVVTPTGRYLRAFGGQGQAPGQFVGPHAVSVASDGTVWVADTFNARIQHLTATGQVIAVSAAHVNGAWGVAADGRGGVYYSARWGQRVYHLDQHGQLEVWGGPGSGSGEFNHPTALAASADGSIVYVVDENNARIQYIRNGQVAGQRGGPNPGPAGLGYPVAVAVAADGSIAVLDAGRYRVARYQGAAADDFISIDTADTPLGIAAAGDGALTVTEYGHWSGATSQQTVPPSAGMALPAPTPTPTPTAAP